MTLITHDGARRKLQFVPSSQRTYYLDISSTKQRAKVVQRILALQGKIEEFLSKDVNLVLTDRNNISKESETPETSSVTQKQTLPLSRGKILKKKFKRVYEQMKRIKILLSCMYNLKYQIIVLCRLKKISFYVNRKSSSTESCKTQKSSK